MISAVGRRRPSVLVLVGTLGALAAACAAQDQLAAQPSSGASGPVHWSDGGEGALRREFGRLVEQLNAQQRQLQRQARRLELMQQALESRTMDSRPPSGRRGSGEGVPVSIGSALPCRADWADESGSPSGGSASCDACPSSEVCPPQDGCLVCGPDDGGAGDGGPWIDIGGQYRLIYDGSNFDFHSPTIGDDQQSQNFFNQRFRTWVEMYTRPDVGVCFQVEMGHIIWGAAPEFPKTYPGPFSGPGDRVGVELRRGYLIYGDPATGVWRAGIQDWHDAFGESYTLGTFGAVDDYDSFGAVLANSVWDFNVAGLSYAGPAAVLSDVNLNAGMFLVWEGDTHGADDAFLLAFDFDRAFRDKHTIGFSVYYLVDRGEYSYPITLPGGQAFHYDSAWDVWIGLRASTVLGRIPIRGFAIFNTGQRKDLGGLPRFRHDDVALKLELGPIPIGPGKVSFQTLYSTGDGKADETRRNGFRTIAQSARDNFGAQGYWSYLLLTSPHGPSDVNDLGVSLQNRGLGLFTAQAKYAYPLLPRLSGVLAVGWLQSDAANPASGSRDMGTELANMFTYDFGGGLTLDFGAAVLFTGDFYRQPGSNEGPDDLWEAFTRAQVEF